MFKAKHIFVTAIDTGVGKTLVSAILSKAFNADYWKPIQAGELDYSDSQRVRQLLGTKKSTKIHPEAYRLKLAASPHYAAEQEGLEIDIYKIKLPKTENNLIIEGAGGVLCPINRLYQMRDLILYLQKSSKLSVVLVCKNYLGSISHTLLSLEALQSQRINVAGLIFSGESHAASEDYICQAAQVKIIARIPTLNEVTAKVIGEYAANINKENFFGTLGAR
ncbi:MAG: dethiobiotin synthase [Oligoflexales bacterium]|nr:dethiobiotin synthase [Oligoflexales bacterium]